VFLPAGSLKGYYSVLKIAVQPGLGFMRSAFLRPNRMFGCGGADQSSVVNPWPGIVVSAQAVFIFCCFFVLQENPMAG
jgi:hypothetical protein